MYVEDCNFECHALEKKPRKHKKKTQLKTLFRLFVNSICTCTISISSANL